MFETMLRDMLLKLIREDAEFREEVVIICQRTYDNSVRSIVKHTIENDAQVQDVIRKQATTDIGELIVEVVLDSSSIGNSIENLIERKISNLTFEVNVR